MNQANSSLTKKERLSAILCYCVFPFHFVPALVVWVIWKGQSEFVCSHARNALNIYLIFGILFVSLLLLWPTPSPIPAVYLAVAHLAILLVAAHCAWQGTSFAYPRFLHLIR